MKTTASSVVTRAVVPRESKLIFRGVPPTKTHPDAIRPDLASSLNNLSASLADLGRRPE